MYARSEAPGGNVPEHVSMAGAGAGLLIAGVRRTRGRRHRYRGLVAALAFVVPAALFYARWVGGVTGDALGTVVELAELAALTTAVAAL